MALFFDRQWFDAKLGSLGLTRSNMAALARVSPEDVDLMFKDQMEVSASHVQVWAELLGESSGEIAKRCGVSTPKAIVQSDAQKIEILAARVARLEAQIQEVVMQLSAKS